MSSPLAGAVMITFSAPASRCLDAPGVSMNTPVPSMTIWTPSSFQGSFRGSRLDTISMDLPSMEMWVSSTIFTSASKVPRMESYFTRWDACLTPPESLIATTSRPDSARPCQQRRKLRPVVVMGENREARSATGRAAKNTDVLSRRESIRDVRDRSLAIFRRGEKSIDRHSVTKNFSRTLGTSVTTSRSFVTRCGSGRATYQCGRNR